MEEKELIKKIQNGSRRHYRELIERYGERLMCDAYKFMKNTQDAEDLYQDTFIKVYENIDTFKFKSQFYTWVYRIMANLAFNRFRKRKKMQIVDDQDDYLWDTLPADHNSEPENKMPKKKLKEKVDKAIANLSPRQKTVFVMKHYEGKKIKDIAAILGCHSGTVKKYLYRATRKLRTSISTL
ncbi:MAG: RNA polymerase sigma factor [Candidatus Marinimicrobia bacterium]|nr:RNA polymerase sigma factor [Candidatus Neomarinimicrobiota bacterium]